MRKLTIAMACLMLSTTSFAASLISRLGVGISDHLVTDMKTISFKLQNSSSGAIGGSFGIDTSEAGTFYALGFKYYNLIYIEPQVNFYSALGLNIFTYEDQIEPEKIRSGYQIDGLFGAEFSFQGLESLGFSFEFGVSVNQFNEQTHIETVGNNFLKSAIHFYL